MVKIPRKSESDAIADPGEVKSDGPAPEAAPEAVVTTARQTHSVQSTTPTECLRRVGKMSADQQVKQRADVDAAFQAFIDSHPSRDEFCDVLHGVVLTPYMLYVALFAGRS